ncbi:unnamed protein product [Clonostachys chloroleuca]|uniref:Fumarylacetoacetase-like C-terminal domain-containing protein n=1 Tax=Clonostachys chloroleuca TaxID=1926264 RepID=A0AA35QBK8_9HYPO|nr:unnamed protein product [Clonostachys chloroleuca]
MKVPWSRLIRFHAADGRALQGEPILPRPDFDLDLVTEADNIQFRVITGDDPYDTTGAAGVTEELVTVKQILRPLTAKDVPILRFVALNYLKHRELIIVIGKDAKNVSQEDAMDYVAAYMIGNDISSRKLLRDPNYADRVPQQGFSKGFDTFAPLGPCLVSSALVREPRDLLLKTTIDDQVRQDGSVSDLLFDCRNLISYLSQGTTLEKGSVIMTGTPGGVDGDMKPPSWLRPGTQMEVHISETGTLRNEVAYAKIITFDKY